MSQPSWPRRQLLLAPISSPFSRAMAVVHDAHSCVLRAAHKGGIDFVSDGYLRRSARGATASCLCVGGRTQPDPTSLLLFNSLHRALQRGLAGETDVGVKNDSCVVVPPRGLCSLPRSLVAQRSSPAPPAAAGVHRATPEGLIPNETKTPFLRNLPR